MAEQLSGINGTIIQWAREYYNMSEENAAHAIGIDVERYQKWESGDEYPTYAKLKQISATFHRPTAIFFFSEPPVLPDIRGDLRTLSNSVINSFSKNVIIQFEKAKIYQLNLYELYGERDTLLSHINASSMKLGELCVFLRKQFDFPISAQKSRHDAKVVFEVYRQKFYEYGIYVFKDAFKDDSISGLSINDPQYPVIIINNSMSFERQNFTLFHELYHLLLNSGGVEIIRDSYYRFLNSEQTTMEKQCDRFANEFLMPTEDFQSQLARIQVLSENRIAQLAGSYSVSKEAVMYKLLQLNKISPQDYEELKEFFYGDAIRKKSTKEDTKDGGNHYYTKLSYLGSQYTGEVFRQYFSGKIDNYMASEMLSTKASHLSKLESTFFKGVAR